MYLTVHGTKIVNIFIFAHSLEMEEERVYNEMSSFHNVAGGGSAAAGTLAAAGAVHAASVHRTRTVSSPVPVNVSFLWNILTPCIPRLKLRYE